MADYDASVRVHTEVDNSKLNETGKKIKDVGEAAGKEIEKAAQKIKQQEGSWDSLLHKAEEFKTRLRDLGDKGFGPGDKIYDEAYIGWQNAEYALKQYLAELDKTTDAGIAKEAERVSREQERLAAKEAERTAKLQEQAAEEQRIADIQNNAVVHNQDLVNLLEQQEAIMERMAELRGAGAGEGYQEYDALAAKLKAVNAEIQEQRGGFEKAAAAGKKCFSAINSSAGQSVGILGEVDKKLTKLAVGVLIVNQIRKAFNSMVSAAKEGFKNLAQYSQDYNRQMSALTSSLAQTKNALAAAFEPVVNTIIPYLTQLVSWLNIVIDKVGQFLAAISGSSTYTKAKKQTVDYAKSIDTAAKAAKGALASFDELVVVSQNTAGGSSAGGELKGADAFETAQIDSKIIEELDSIKAVIKPFIDEISEWWSEINFDPLLDSLDHLKTACEPFVGYLQEGLMFFLTEILEPLGSWTIEEALPAFLDMVASGLEFLSKVIDTVQPGLSYIWEHVLKPMAEYTGDAIIWALNTISDAFKKMSDMIGSKSDEINEILEALGKIVELIWVEQIKPTLDFIMGAAGELIDYIIALVGDLIDILAGIIEFLTGVFTGDWEKAWQGLVKIFKGIVNGIIDIFEGVVNSFIEGLNNISIDVPDWVPGIGGEHFGLDFEKLHLPRLAEGAVIPGGKPFAALLGDQVPGQTNIETPLETMVEAFKTAMQEVGGYGDITVVAELDGEVVYQDVIRRDQIHKRATGEI